jgi:hypothetical protein
LADRATNFEKSQQRGAGRKNFLERSRGGIQTKRAGQAELRSFSARCRKRFRATAEHAKG